MLFELIRQRRLAGLTQRQLAAKAGISAETISRLERAGITANPETSTLQRLAAALGKAPRELFPELLSSEPAA
jgi:transcriptional regulator with XRE-family HTH domain